jgi:hypothetical protein
MTKPAIKRFLAWEHATWIPFSVSDKGPWWFRNSDFGILSGFGFRVSDFPSTPWIRAWRFGLHHSALRLAQKSSA